jgi:hypothetical protein
MSWNELDLDDLDAVSGGGMAGDPWELLKEPEFRQQTEKLAALFHLQLPPGWSVGGNGP